MHRFANPLRYQRIADAVLPWAGGAAVVLMLLGLYLALIEAPPDYQQGEAYRIMYVHVPAARWQLVAGCGSSGRVCCGILQGTGTC
jgi:heme exporter protein C